MTPRYETGLVDYPHPQSLMDGFILTTFIAAALVFIGWLLLRISKRR